MKISDAKRLGEFKVRACIGQYFSDKARSDFKTDAEWKKHLKSIEESEYIVFREPTSSEMFAVNRLSAIPKNTLQGFEKDQMRELLSIVGEEDENFSKKLVEGVKKCIVEHSFVDEKGQQCAVDVVWRELIEPRSSLMLKLVEIWSGGFSNF